MTITEQIIKCAMLKGMTQRNFPMFNLLNAAREDQQISQGMAIVMTDAYGQRVLMPGPNAPAAPAPEPVATVVDTSDVDSKLSALKTEINGTQGRALSSVETSIRADMKKMFEEYLGKPQAETTPPKQTPAAKGK